MQSNKIESGVQLFSRINQRPVLAGINPSIFKSGGPFPNQTVEIISDRDCDKDELLIDFIVRCILPTNIHSECKGSGVIFIITEFKINILEIVKALEKFINKTDVKKEAKHMIIENALKNLILIKCFTLEQLEMTYFNLERLIHNRASISLVVIDNIGSFYWRAKSEQCMLSYTQYCVSNCKSLQNKLRNMQVVLMFGNRAKYLKNMERLSKEVNMRIHIQESEGKVSMCVSDYEANETNCVQCS